MWTKLAKRPGLVAGPSEIPSAAARSRGTTRVAPPLCSSAEKVSIGIREVKPDPIGFAAFEYSKNRASPLQSSLISPIRRPGSVEVVAIVSSDRTPIVLVTTGRSLMRGPRSPARPAPMSGRIGRPVNVSGRPLAGLVVDGVVLRPPHRGLGEAEDLEPGVGRLFDDGQTVRRHFGDRGGQGVDVGLQGFVGDNIGGEPDGGRLPSADEPAGEEQLLRLGQPDPERPEPEGRGEGEFGEPRACRTVRSLRTRPGRRWPRCRWRSRCNTRAPGR